MEPDFTRAITSRFVCDYLYFYYWLAVVVAALSVLGTGAAVILSKGGILQKILMALPNLLVASLAVLTALSLYIICERGLRPEESNNTDGRSAEGFSSQSMAYPSSGGSMGGGRRMVPYAGSGGSMGGGPKFMPNIGPGGSMGGGPKLIPYTGSGGSMGGGPKLIPYTGSGGSMGGGPKLIPYTGSGGSMGGGPKFMPNVGPGGSMGGGPSMVPYAGSGGSSGGLMSGPSFMSRLF